MKMGIGDAAVLFVGQVDGEVADHTPADKLLQQKLPCEGDALLQRKLVLQGDVKAICQLCLGMRFRFFYGVPECLAVCVFRRSVGRQ